MSELKEMWDAKYADLVYAYGIGPNKFLKEVINNKKITGDILFAAEGEGRNAVFAASKGLNATAFDISTEGKKKALQLAKHRKVEIDYQVGDLLELPLLNKKYDCAAFIYAHFPPDLLSKYHKIIGDLIKPGGLVILEGFCKEHLAYREYDSAVGGPNKLELLFDKDSIRDDFSDFEILQLKEVEVELSEGVFHNGIGKVVRFIGRKK